MKLKKKVRKRKNPRDEQSKVLNQKFMGIRN